MRITASVIKENLEARLTLPGQEPYAVMGIFPEDSEFDMTLLSEDHYCEIVLNDVTRSLAIVAEGSLFDTVAHLYFAYFPTKFPSRVFRTEAEALVWVNEQIALWDQ